jgi:hypothetical protein
MAIFCHVENGQIDGFARVTEIPIFFAIWFSWKFYGIVLFGSLLDQFVTCKQFCSCLCAFNIQIRWLFNRAFDQQIQRIADILFSFILLESKIKICVAVDGDIFVKLEFWNSLLELECFAGSMMGPRILLFFRCFFWRSGLLECGIQSYVRGHWFGSSLRQWRKFIMLQFLCFPIGWTLTWISSHIRLSAFVFWMIA